MSPFELLELGPLADEREIKRAYARLLKCNRPDEDAGAFQRLQAAYAHCLQIARQRDAPASGSAGRKGIVAPDASPGDDRDARWRAPAVAPPPPDAGATGHGHPGEAPEDGPAQRHADPPVVREATFDVAAFVDAIHPLLAQPSPRRMQDWLYAQEPLYSVQLKHALRPVVVRAIEEAPRLDEPQVIAILLAFFGLDQMDREGLAERVQAVLEHRYQTGRLNRLVQALATRDQSWLNRRIAAELAGPLNLLRRFFLLLVPLVPSRIRNTLDELRRVDAGLRHPRLEPGAIAFWTQAAEPFGFNRPRLVMVALRVVAWNAMIFGLVAVLLLDTYPDIWRTCGYWMAGAAGLWTLYALVKWLWFRGARWAIGRAHLLPEEYDALFSSLLGAGLSWALGQNPFPVLIGGIRGYAAMIQPMAGPAAIGSILMALAGPVGWLGLTRSMEDSLDPSTRFTLILTLSLLPLLAAPWVRRYWRLPPGWSPLLLSQGLATVVIFAALLLP